MYYTGDLTEKLRSSIQLVIFGAGLVGFEAANCLLGEPYRLQIDFFMVSMREGNPAQVMGIPVLDLEAAEGVIDKNAAVVAAVMERHLASIREALLRRGYTNIIPMTFEGDLWSLVQGDYYREWRLSCHKPYLTLEEALGDTERVQNTGAAESRNSVRNAEPVGDTEPLQGAGTSENAKLIQNTEAAENRKTSENAELVSGAESVRDAGKRKVSVYAVKSHVDRKLQEDLSLFGWEIPIQAGAALTDKHICDIRDDTGINISHKNKRYCELTALYWIWKNDASDYAGLCHYRRHFELDEGMLKRLAHSDIDVVLTLPILNFPSVREVYRHDHEEGDWDVMLEAVRVLAPDYTAAAAALQNGNFYYGYNMFIARKEILDDYCAWLFPILEYCEKKCGGKENGYQERYIGFLGERLLSIYMAYHENRYRIVHARKHFVGN